MMRPVPTLSVETPGHDVDSQSLQQSESSAAHRNIQHQHANGSSLTPVTALTLNQPPQDQSSQQPASAPPSLSTSTTTGSSAAVKEPKVCYACKKVIEGHFVRALNGHYHLDCFQCMDCHQVVAEKFFPLKAADGTPQIFCEKDYFRRLDLLCAKCGGALRGPHINALNKKYHLEHFSCSACPTVFRQHDSYYERGGQVYCQYHYSVLFAAKCGGCQMAVLKNFVEMNKEGEVQQWHPECYMIYKLFYVKLASSRYGPLPVQIPGELSGTAEEETRRQQQTTEKAARILYVLNAFEESSAECISEMLHHFTSQSYEDGIVQAGKFICHVEALYAGIDEIDAQLAGFGEKTGLQHNREPKQLAKKVVHFFSLLSQTSKEGEAAAAGAGQAPNGAGAQKPEGTQDLISLVTTLAHVLKLHIRAALNGALKLERVHGSPTAINDFLDRLSSLGSLSNGSSHLLPREKTDLCVHCRKSIEEECIKQQTTTSTGGVISSRRWHVSCFRCRTCDADLRGPRMRDAFSVEITLASASEGEKSKKDIAVYCRDHLPEGTPPGAVRGGFERVTQLEQYTFLLRCALKRLCILLKVKPEPQGQFAIEVDNYTDRMKKSQEKIMAGLAQGNAGGVEMGVANENGDGDRGAQHEQLQQRSIGFDYNSDSQAGTSKVPSQQSRQIDSDSFSHSQTGMHVAGVPGDQFMIYPRDASLAERFSNGSNSSSASLPIYQSNAMGYSQGYGGQQMPPQYYNQQMTRNIQFNSAPRSFASVGSDGSFGSSPQTQFNGMNMNMVGVVQGSTGGPRYLSELSGLVHLVVRQLAVLHMYPLVSKEIPSLEQLREYVESPGGNGKSVWSKMAGMMNPGKSKIKDGTFGVPLDVLVDRHGADWMGPSNHSQTRIPLVVDGCIRYLLEMDLTAEGIFRKNGNIRRLKVVSESLDRDPRAIDLSDDNPIQIAALIKKFLRELPEPLLTFKLHKLFILSQKLPDPKARKQMIHLVVCLLPKANLDLLEVLCWFLRHVANHNLETESATNSSLTATNPAASMTTVLNTANSNYSTVNLPATSESTTTEFPLPSNVGGASPPTDYSSGKPKQPEWGNRMTLDNLATVIAPNILYSKSKNPVDDEAFLAIEAVRSLLEYQDELWVLPESIEKQLREEFPDYNSMGDPTGKEEKLLKRQFLGRLKQTV
ncbi:hypothetical protein BJ742DRAFT_246254 [Cladochytrium replicatum]|nr:hypothetical protein BJ742DRAFT_246254 [Cladochytrium replicatum]